jgi:hypothetical protein
MLHLGPSFSSFFPFSAFRQCFHSVSFFIHVPSLSLSSTLVLLLCSLHFLLLSLFLTINFILPSHCLHLLFILRFFLCLICIPFLTSILFPSVLVLCHRLLLLLRHNFFVPPLSAPFLCYSFSFTFFSVYLPPSTSFSMASSLFLASLLASRPSSRLPFRPKAVLHSHASCDHCTL